MDNDEQEKIDAAKWKVELLKKLAEKDNITPKEGEMASAARKILEQPNKLSDVLAEFRQSEGYDPEKYKKNVSDRANNDSGEISL